MTLEIWNSKINSPEEALELESGFFWVNLDADRLCIFQIPVQTQHTLEAAKAFVDADISITVATQGELVVLAQEHKVAFTDWVSRLTRDETVYRSRLPQSTQDT